MEKTERKALTHISEVFLFAVLVVQLIDDR